MRWRRCLSLAAAGLVVAAGILAGSAGAAKPTFELITVNEELAGRNTELNRVNSDLNNLQTSARLPIVLLSRDPNAASCSRPTAISRWIAWRAVRR